MKKVLLLGAGLSSTSLIIYLLNNSRKYNWHITIGDYSLDLVNKKIDGHPNASGIQFDANNKDQMKAEVSKSDLVISMLPARMHYLVANECLSQKKNMITASYIGNEIKDMDKQVKEAGLLFLNEIGVDPGIDHMSAMEVINRIKEEGGHLTSFKSSTGGLVAPEYDNNPWKYKFTWNPRNVVLAGQGVSMYIKNGNYKYIPYHKLFKRLETISLSNVGDFESYPNRDSLQYRETYGLLDIKTMFRGTLRRPGFCSAWDIFVQLGMTDSTFQIENSANMTYREFVNSFLKYDIVKPVEQKLSEYLGISLDSEEMSKLNYLEIFSNEKIGLDNATPAQILQHRLEQKWKLADGDKDMIVMQHQFEYELGDRKKKIVSSLVVMGKNSKETAMAITVGIPLAIAAKLILTGVINETGVHRPCIKSIYEPVLKELHEYGITFQEEEFDIT